MAARIIEVTAFIIVFSILFIFFFTASLLTTPIVKERVKNYELEAKQLYIALDNLYPSNTSLPPETSVIDLLRNYYLTGDTTMLNLFTQEVKVLAPQLLGENRVWRVKTSDNKVDIKSSFFEEAEVTGSAYIPLLNNTELIVVVGSV